MNLIAKSFITFIGILFVNVLAVLTLSDDGNIHVLAVIFLMIEMVLAVCAFMHRTLLRPIFELSESLSVINFDNDIIDFSKVDMLEEKGFKEVRRMIEKYKYLLDIITERINRYNNETFKSEHDELTGCYNRVHLTRVKSRYETQRSCYLVFIDVNNLKKMNDIFGHDAGDTLLKNASAKLKFWDSYGDVYRMGGDEFMVVLLNKKQSYCEGLLSSWYPKVGILNRESDGFKCALSYGVAYGTAGCDFDALQQQADEAMYQMKIALKKQYGEELR